MQPSASDNRPLRATFVMEQHLGHQTFAENLRRFVDRDEDVTARWVDIAYGEQGAVWERLPGLGDRARGALRGRMQVRGGCRSGDTDVRFFNTQVPAVLGGRRARALPYVLCTDVTPIQYDSMATAYGHVADGDGPVARCKDLLNRSVFRAAAHNVVWSSWVRDSLVREYEVPPERIDVIPPGVDLRRWSPVPRVIGPRARLLFVGGDFARKGGQQLLEAFRALPSGSAELRVVTRTPLPGSPDVRTFNGLTPNSPELLSLFHTSDVFVIPSAGETFGIAAVEAAAAGLPVVATRVGGFADIVDDGRTGFLVDPMDVQALTDRLHRLVSDHRLRWRMGTAGRERAVQRFDAQRNARRIVDVLQRASGRVRADAAPAVASV